MVRDKDLVRLATVGSVDDGKSTLIGRLLVASEAVPEDQLVAVAAAAERKRKDLDLALLTDGLRAEREQGITIDVAYRYFQSGQRRFIIADTPGHEQYTRNMVTGASCADLIILLIDARAGIQTQTRRHAFIASLLGVPNVLVAVNKMDLVDYSQDRFEAICEEYRAFCSRLQLSDLCFVPISALQGDNVVARSAAMDWYTSSTVLEHLERCFVGRRHNLRDFRMPVQLVARPGPEFRGYAGQIASGVVRVGEEVLIQPRGQTARVASIHSYNGDLDEAFAPQSVTLTLDTEIDVSRGDVVVHPGNRAWVRRSAETMLIWLADQALDPQREYLIKLGTSTVKARFPTLSYVVDPDSLRRRRTAELGLNEIGRATLRSHRPLVCDAYEQNRPTGSFVVIDPHNHATLAAGIILERGLAGRTAAADPVSQNLHPSSGPVDQAAREELLGQRAATLWLTGLSGSGKSTLAYGLEQALTGMGHLVYVLDGDNLRHGLNRDLGFAPEDRSENIRRVAEVAALFQAAGVIVITAFISPYEVDRRVAQEILGAAYLEVFVDTPLEVCEERDPKQLYQRARRGEIPEFTGVSAPYETPEHPALRLDTTGQSPADSVQTLLAFLRQQSLIQ